MTNRLIDKIHSYAVKNGIDFDDTFTGVWPAQYGTSFSSGQQQVLNTNNALISENNDGPFPGQKSWRFRNGQGQGYSSRLRWTSAGNESTVGANYVRPQNFTYSIWVRVNSMNANPFYNRAFAEYTNYLGNGQPGDTDDWYMGWYMGYVKNNNSGDANYNLPIFNIYTGGIDAYIPTDHNDDFIQYGKWYLLTVRKTKINSTTVEVEFMINGVVKQIAQHTYGDNATAVYDHGQSTTTIWVDHSLACSFLGSNSVFTQSVIQDIYDYGSPIQVPVKYYDGSNWVDSSDQQIWNGSKWIPMYANRWTGTEWVPI